MLRAFVYLARFALFHKLSDWWSHISPIHRLLQGFLESCMTRMLQIVVVPSYCPILKFSRDDKPSILAQHMSIFNELTFVPMLAYFSGLIYPSFVQVQFLRQWEEISHRCLCDVWKHSLVFRLCCFCVTVLSYTSILFGSSNFAALPKEIELA